MRRSATLSNIRKPGSRRFSLSVHGESSDVGHRLPLSPLSRAHSNPILSSTIQEYDVLYENQRGFYFLGIPKFSANLLNPLDPPAWCDRFGKGVSTDIQTYSLPDPTWEWVTDKWLVDMSGDVDPNGWQYAFRFRQRNWRGDAKAFHNFVRRRRWIRLRRKKPNHDNFMGSYGVPDNILEHQPMTPSSINSIVTSGSSSIEPESTGKAPSDLTLHLMSSRVDREKLAIIQKEISQRKTPFTKLEIEEILNCMEYESSRKRLQQLIDEHTAECAALLDLTTQTTESPSLEYSNLSSQLRLPGSRFKDSSSGTKVSIYLDARSYLE
ncbi:hypothetical protein DSO57_1016818 [Entomophthora muscae]|uniref:Uncharacterized protein n=1 Tax=Entomophthora muscae TaxID=34485 RepID=A0ACC2UES5_9FUNG|nr:hypothetical protein DSO57_1016818 [Entomophthora muscae]